MAKKCKKIEKIKEMFRNIEIELDDINTNEIQNIMVMFKNQKDTRIQGKVKHNITDIIMIAFWQY